MLHTQLIRLANEFVDTFVDFFCNSSKRILNSSFLYFLYSTIMLYVCQALYFIFVKHFSGFLYIPIFIVSFLLKIFQNSRCTKRPTLMDRSLLDYNLPATASKSSWIFAWLLPPAMAISGLPPPRPSTIGANSLTRFPA